MRIEANLNCFSYSFLISGKVQQQLQHPNVRERGKAPSAACSLFPNENISRLLYFLLDSFRRFRSLFSAHVIV